MKGQRRCEFPGPGAFIRPDFLKFSIFKLAIVLLAQAEFVLIPCRKKVTPQKKPEIRLEKPF